MVTKKASWKVAMDLGMVLENNVLCGITCPAGKDGSSTAGAKASSTPCIFYLDHVCLHVSLCFSFCIYLDVIVAQGRCINLAQGAKRGSKQNTHSLPTPSMYHPDRPDHDHIATTPSSHRGPTRYHTTTLTTQVHPIVHNMPTTLEVSCEVMAAKMHLQIS